MSSPTFGEILELTHPTAEGAILAGMLADSEQASEIVQALEPTDFHNERYGVVFEAMRNLLSGTEPIDKPAVVAECKRVIQHRGLKLAVNESHLIFEGDPKRAASYAQTVKRLSWLRNAAGFAHWMIQELQGRPDPEALFGEAQEKWQQLRPVQKTSSFVYGWDTVNMYDEFLAAEKNPPDKSSYLSWPWHTWNQKIRPHRKGTVGTLAAPDGMGKSIYLEMIAECWAMQDTHTVLVHLEDDLGYKKDRRLARYSHVDFEHIEDRRLDAAEKVKVRDAEQRICDFAGHLHYYHAPGQSMTEIVRELETRVSEGVCQAVVLDYLDKVQPTRAQAKLFSDSIWERQANDMEQFKTFAERAGVPVFTATQGNKDMQGEGVKTRKAIQGSGQKSQKSQLVVILTRELAGPEGQKDKLGNLIAKPGEYSPIVDVRIDKQNRGQTGQFQQVLAGKYFTVLDMAGVV